VARTSGGKLSILKTQKNSWGIFKQFLKKNLNKILQIITWNIFDLVNAHSTCVKSSIQLVFKVPSHCASGSSGIIFKPF
jgi:hypothetical protein